MATVTATTARISAVTTKATIITMVSIKNYINTTNLKLNETELETLKSDSQTVIIDAIL